MEEKKRMKISLRTFTILIVILAILLLGLDYYSYQKMSSQRNQIGNSRGESDIQVDLESKIQYSGKSNIGLNQSILKQLGYEKEYLIVHSYLEYQKWQEKLQANEEYDINNQDRIDQKWFDENDLIIIDQFQQDVSQGVYQANVNSLSCYNGIVYVKLCVDMDRSRDISTTGIGTLFLIKAEKDKVKDVSVNIEFYNIGEPEHDSLIYSINLQEVKKPVIYIYPEEETEVSVILGCPEKLTCVYPEYQNGWKVLAKPDGTLIDLNTQREYYCLYYEAKNRKVYNEGNIQEGFVISNKNIISFLEEKLEVLGLNEKEAEEFIIYWLPRMQQYPYLYIRFQTMEEIEENMPLSVSENPDTFIRIMMEWKGLDREIEVKEQNLTPVTRRGFTVVEWGGTEIK